MLPLDVIRLVLSYVIYHPEIYELYPTYSKYSIINYTGKLFSDPGKIIRKYLNSPDKIKSMNARSMSKLSEVPDKRTIDFLFAHPNIIYDLTFANNPIKCTKYQKKIANYLISQIHNNTKNYFNNHNGHGYLLCTPNPILALKLFEDSDFNLKDNETKYIIIYNTQSVEILNTLIARPDSDKNQIKRYVTRSENLLGWLNANPSYCIPNLLLGNCNIEIIKMVLHVFGKYKYVPNSSTHNIWPLFIEYYPNPQEIIRSGLCSPELKTRAKLFCKGKSYSKKYLNMLEDIVEKNVHGNIYAGHYLSKYGNKFNRKVEKYLENII